MIRKLLKGQGRSPRIMTGDKLRSYGTAKRETGVECRSHKGPEQSSGKVSSTCPTTGEDHEALQVRATASAFRFHPRPRLPTSFTFRSTTSLLTTIGNCKQQPWILGAKSLTFTLHEPKPISPDLVFGALSLQCHHRYSPNRNVSWNHKGLVPHLITGTLMNSLEAEARGSAL